MTHPSETLKIGTARSTRVRIITTRYTYEGAYHVPDTKRRFSDAINDDKPFLRLVGVTYEGASEPVPFMLIHKDHIEAIIELPSE